MATKRLIVSRHPAGIAFLREQLPQFRDAPVLAVASAEDVRDALVAGNLPLALAAEARAVAAIEFAGAPPRGAEYSLEDMRAAGARIAWYRVQAMPMVGARPCAPDINLE